MSMFEEIDEPRTATRERTEADDLFTPRTFDAPALVGQSAQAQSPEFEALMVMAQGRKRDENQLTAAAKRIGERMGERAIYSFPAGGGRIEGPTVHLIEALAQEYGNLLYGTRIDRIDGDRVHLVGMVIDAINGNVFTRPSVFHLPPAPAKFANKADQVARWESMQTQNAISKAGRTVLQHAMPRWYIDVAYNAADRVRRAELKLKDGQTMEDAVAESVAYFAKLGITEKGMESRVGAPRALWTISDLFSLRSDAKSLRDGTLSREAFREPEPVEPPPSNLAERIGAKPKPAVKPKPTVIDGDPTPDERAAILAAEAREAAGGTPDDEAGV